MPEEENVCAVCKKTAKKRCGGCQAVYYCSQEHQKSDWKTHSKMCHPYKLEKNSQLGRHYIATRDIKVGETIIRDKPLITGPLYPIALKFDGDISKVPTPPVCLGCYVDLTADNAKPCGKCGWPLCLKCTKHGSECEFTSKYRKSKVKITEFGKSHMAYEGMAVIRSLALRDTDREAYRRLLKLEDHCSKLEAPSTCTSPSEMARFIKSFFDLKDVEEAELARLHGIGLTNGYETSTTVPSHYAVYDRASYIEHNCRANCSQSYTPEGDFVLRAAVPISKGDHITISYTKSRWGTERRRSVLANSKFFDCICERCKDPTEFGTMLSAYKCIMNKLLYISPNQRVNEIIKFLHFVLLPYTPVGSADLGEEYDTMPMIIGGDFNINFSLDEAEPLILFLREKLNLRMNTNRNIPTTNSDTTIDAVFSRSLETLQSQLNCSGNMLPPTFLVTGDNYPDYICSECNAKVPWGVIKMFELKIDNHWLALQKNDINQCRQFLKTWKRVLHENHYYNFDVGLKMMKAYDKNYPDLKVLPDECLVDLKERCTKLANLLLILVPDENVRRANVLYLKVGAIDALNDKHKTESTDVMISRVKETKNLLMEVHALFRRETSPATSLLAQKIFDEITGLQTAEKMFMLLAGEGDLLR